VNPHGAKGERSTDDVAVEEDFVGGVADGGGRLEEEESEGDGAL
jgi:hypothetical protein